MARPRRRGDQQRSWVLWPCYFDARLSRAEGRRIPKTLAVREPRLEELVAACRKQRIESIEEPKAAHPSFWSSPSGRLRVIPSERFTSKEQLIRELAGGLRRSRQARD